MRRAHTFDLLDVPTMVRGPKLTSPYAPTGGYRYDGLYAVEDRWEDRGKAGLFESEG